MLIESVAGESRQAGGRLTFWWRLADNFFRRIHWYILPIVAMGFVGFVQAGNALELYRSAGRLSATTNPYLPEPVNGINAQYWETPADATSRVINERLGTNSFLTDVADEAGLTEMVEAGFIDVSVIGESIWASADGDSILTVHAEWDDPNIAYELVRATIREYQEFLAATAASDFTEAEAFWTEELEKREQARDAAEAELDAFVRSLPPMQPGEDLPLDVERQWDRLVDKVDSIEASIDAARAEIDSARLSQTQQSSQADRSLSVIDPPTVPSAPESTVMKRIVTFASFVLLGAVISAAALLVTTVLDQTVASPADVLAIQGVPLVATVPPVRIANGDAGSRRRLPGRFRRRAPIPVGGRT